MEFGMKKTGITLLALVLAALSGCGGTVDRSCDDVRAYQLAAQGRRISPPDDLDPLDELKEIPLPEASPRPERPKGSPCLDLPPNILTEE